MRELTLEELELIAGGTVTAGTAGNDSGGDIVVTANPGDDGGYYPPMPGWDGGGDYGDWGGGGGGDGGGGGGDTGIPYSPGFDPAMDDRADALAAQLGAQIAAMPDADKYEYGALIWKDASGNLHTTTIERGTTNTTPLGAMWGQVDFANGGQVVGVIHSHPTLYNAGSADVPNWQPATQGGTLSSGDFDQMLDRAAGNVPGFDAANSRSYLVYGNVVSEYYAKDQNAAMYGAGGQASWAVPSSDYGQ